METKNSEDWVMDGESVIEPGMFQLNYCNALLRELKRMFVEEEPMFLIFSSLGRDDQKRPYKKGQEDVRVLLTPQARVVVLNLSRAIQNAPTIKSDSGVDVDVAVAKRDVAAFIRYCEWYIGIFRKK